MGTSLDLYLAFFNNDTHRLKNLINYIDDGGRSSLFTLACTYHGHLETCKYLFSIGINKDIIIKGFEYTFINGNYDVVKWLVSIGVDVCINDNKAIQTASTLKYYDIVTFLLSIGVYHIKIKLPLDYIYDLFHGGQFDIVLKLIKNRNYIVNNENDVDLLQFNINKIINNKIINRLTHIYVFTDIVIKINLS